MNAVLLRHMLVLLLGVIILLTLSGFAAAGEAGSLTLQANFLSELVGDRARMIQASLVFVLLGCALLWWRK
jgi:hypothetical protein